MKNIRIIGIAILIIAFSAMSALATTSAGPSFEQSTLSIRSNSEVSEFTIEIAQTSQQQTYGFMNRKNIPADHGMLFIWPEDMRVSMWMKDTPSPLDMLFIDRWGKIVYITENAEPYSENILDPHRPIRAVLELVAGTVAVKHIQIGDQVIHSFFKL